jgi:hypothetical protein
MALVPATAAVPARATEMALALALVQGLKNGLPPPRPPLRPLRPRLPPALTRPLLSSPKVSVHSQHSISLAKSKPALRSRFLSKAGTTTAKSPSMLLSSSALALSSSELKFPTGTLTRARAM